MRKFGLTAVLLAILVLAGCGGSSSGFENVKWKLESYGDADSPRQVISGSNITAVFESKTGQVGGSAGCNSYFGSYRLKNGLEIGMLGNTEMYCMEPEGIMDQETEYLRILGMAESYSLEDGRLEIECGDEVLVFGMVE